MSNSFLIIGCKGQLGTDMTALFKKELDSVVGIDFPDIDISDKEQTSALVRSLKPSCIVNCAAYTAVDLCEKEVEKAMIINGRSMRNLSDAAKAHDAKLVHISTDYVFDGTKTTPYTETDTPNPMSVYGKSKLLGEEIIQESGCDFAIFRIAWLYGNHGQNFLKTIHKKALENKKTDTPLTVVNDQFGSPTFTMDVCRQILHALQHNCSGIYHCTGEGSCSWFDFASQILTSLQIETKILPCTTDQFPRQAPRPKYSVLENLHLKNEGIHIMRPWQEALKDFIDNYYMH